MLLNLKIFSMKVLKFIAFGLVYIVMIIKHAGFVAFVDSLNDTKKIIAL